MVEIALQEGPLQAVQVHGSTREVLVVLTVLSSYQVVSLSTKNTRGEY